MNVMKTFLMIGMGLLSAQADEVRMIVEPSSTKVSMAKANLIVSPLDHQEKAYLGSYELKVTPFTFKSETGKLFLNATDEVVRQMANGESVKFTGKATNAKGNVKVVTGKTTAAANDRGAVSFSVETDNGPMVFNTSYHLIKR